jgi:site-specific recombinase XerD
MRALGRGPLNGKLGAVLATARDDPAEPHALTHSFAARLIQNGESLEFVR